MSEISSISTIRSPEGITQGGQQQSVTDVAEPEESFADALSGFVGNVNDLQSTAGELQRQLIAGEGPDLHQVMIASEKAGVAFELLLEVRNKLVEAYQQLMRMPV